MVKEKIIMSKREDIIRKRTDRQWEEKYRCNEAIPENKICYISVYGKTCSKVKNTLPELQTKGRNEISEQKNHALTSFYAEKRLIHIKNHCKYSTYIKYKYIYEGHIRNHFEYIPLSDLSEETCGQLLLQEYQNCGQTLSMSTMNSIKHVLNQILKYGKVNFNVSMPEYIQADKKFERHEVSIFTPYEQKKFIKYLSKEMDVYKMGVMLCLFSGLRLGEICALSTQNIDLANKTLKISQTVQRIKNESGTATTLYCAPPKSFCSIREIPLCDNMIEIIKKYNSSGTYLINGDSPMEPRTYQYRFNKYLKEAEIPKKNFHSLRHTFATNCIANGMDVKCLSEILGHSDVKTTMNRYVHPSMETKRIQINQCMSEYGQIQVQ